jgi:ABC-type maltose transport system permease subunit
MCRWRVIRLLQPENPYAFALVNKKLRQIPYHCGLVGFLRGKVCPAPAHEYKMTPFLVSLHNTVLNVVVTMASIIGHTQPSTSRQSYKGKSTTLASALFIQMLVMKLMQVERAKWNLVEFHCKTPC